MTAANLLPRDRRAASGADGFGPLGMLLVAAILIGAIGVWISRGQIMPASFAERNAADKLLMQAHGIRAVLDACTQEYPAGSNAVGGRPAFPGGVGVALDFLTCPGAPAARQSLWNGSYGLFLQPPVTGYSWSYSNDSSGVRIVATADAVSQVTALQRLASQLGGYQASVDASSRRLTVWIVQ
jgi:hypothetical protein